MNFQVSQCSKLVVDVQISDFGPEKAPENPSPVETIGVVFTYQTRRSRFEVSGDGERTLVWQRESLRVPLCDHQFSVDILNEIDASLYRFLSWSFKSFREEIDAEIVADSIIERWLQIKDEVNARNSDRVFPMTVNLTAWNIETRYEVVTEEDYGFSSDDGEIDMIPASDQAIAEMLKRLEIEEEEDSESKEEDRGDCVICLDKLKKDDERYVLQMPCLHIFHGKCIEEWLRNSHFCPICRFQMPTVFSDLMN